MGGLPDRWTDYSPMGKVIPGTRFIAFKVPLKEALCNRLSKTEWFTPQDVIDHKNPSVSLVVDLTNTTRYYDKNVFRNANVSYVKIFCPGHVVPNENIISQFFESVDKFLTEHPDDGSLIGVHCTHGVNRTGYFICKYMIDKMGIDPDVAIKDVGHARGHPIERVNYLAALKGEEIPAESTIQVHVRPEREDKVFNWRDSSRQENDERARSVSTSNWRSRSRGRRYELYNRNSSGFGPNRQRSSERLGRNQGYGPQRGPRGGNSRNRLSYDRPRGSRNFSPSKRLNSDRPRFDNRPRYDGRQSYDDRRRYEDRPRYDDRRNQDGRAGNCSSEGQATSLNIPNRR